MANIKIYTTLTCAYCRMAKEFFKANGLAYEEYDVSADMAKQQEMIAKSGQFGVPVIEVNGQIVIGFNKPRIVELLGSDLKKTL